MNTVARDKAVLDLNRDCYCFPIDRDAIVSKIVTLSGLPGMSAELAKRPHYFARTAVFLSQDVIDAMTAQITAIEMTAQLPAFQAAITERSGDPIINQQVGTRGAFMGYDFHITPDSPRLIEVNSNAGGAFIVSALEKAVEKPSGMDDKVYDMFRSEWARAGRTGTPKTIAIVDEAPSQQYHFPDMALARALLEQRGMKVFIVDPKWLSYDGRTLLYGSIPIDLVYNRLTDFDLSSPSSAALREALMDEAAVITPSPRHHALHADKRNLTLLSDSALMQDWGAWPSHLMQLAHIPKTIPVTPENADEFWNVRKQYFFKPNAGFGSRAAYRGAKLTKKVWAHICEGGYVAQSFITPPMRAVTVGDAAVSLKFDVRAYTYAGDIIGLAARAYQGQTTNLRTEGGGLAPIVTIGDITASC